MTRTPNIVPAIGMLSLGAAVSAALAADPSPVIDSRMSFPSAFPAGFMLYETVIDAPGQTLLRRYANGAALRAVRQGKLPTRGAVIVVENSTLQIDAQGRSVAGAVRSYSAMAWREGWGARIPEPLRNADWDYAQFGPDRARRAATNQAPCLACHKPIAATGHVFTLEVLRAAALKTCTSTRC
jgi:Cytochrome P460